MSLIVEDPRGRGGGDDGGCELRGRRERGVLGGLRLVGVGVGVLTEDRLEAVVRHVAAHVDDHQADARRGERIEPGEG